MGWWIVLTIIILVIIIDILQKRHTIRHNFPIIGNFRYLLEAIGPELRQYIVTNNNEERPFDRDQRRWVYASSKRENNYFGFGSDNDLELTSNYIIIKQSAFPKNTPTASHPDFDPSFPLPAAKILGAANDRAKAFRPKSVFNVSAMSFGALSSAAIEALNLGCHLSSCLHNTGEGGVSPYHLQGGDLIFQLGTAYFGCRDKDGRFDPSIFRDLIAKHGQIKAIEIKLSQGAKPGHGGLLPAKKITKELAEVRGIPMGQDCHSPAAHREFRNVDEMIDFIERLSELGGGIPVGIKSAVGQLDFWSELTRRMKARKCGPDYICIDGVAQSTGAAPLVYTDHVALPFKRGFSSVFRLFASAELDQNIVFIGSGKLGFPEEAMLAFALGCDMINLAREPMLAIGCIQAQRCHTNHCPTGVATQNRWLASGLDPRLKAHRLANYMMTLRKEITELCHSCGVCHPAEVGSNMISVMNDRFQEMDLRELFDYDHHWGLVGLKSRDFLGNLHRSCSGDH